MAGPPLGEAAEARARPGVTLRPFAPFAGAAGVGEGGGDWSFIDCEMEEVDLRGLPSAAIACHLDPRVFADGLCRVSAPSEGGPCGGRRRAGRGRRGRGGDPGGAATPWAPCPAPGCRRGGSRSPRAGSQHPLAGAPSARVPPPPLPRGWGGTSTQRPELGAGRPHLLGGGVAWGPRTDSPSRPVRPGREDRRVWGAAGGAPAHRPGAGGQFGCMARERGSAPGLWDTDLEEGHAAAPPRGNTGYLDPRPLHLPRLETPGTVRGRCE